MLFKGQNFGRVPIVKYIKFPNKFQTLASIDQHSTHKQYYLVELNLV